MYKSNLSNAKRVKRLKEWRIWLKSYSQIVEFKKNGWVFIPFAAELLNDFYWSFIEDYIRPLLEENDRLIGFTRIISASELTIMSVSPIIGKDHKQAGRNLVNAEFAWFVATSILLNWSPSDRRKVSFKHLEKIVLFKDSSLNGIKSDLSQSFMDEHITWLSTINTTSGLPILINSQTWQLIYTAAKLLAQKK